MNECEDDCKIRVQQPLERLIDHPESINPSFTMPWRPKTGIHAIIQNDVRGPKWNGTNEKQNDLPLKATHMKRRESKRR